MKKLLFFIYCFFAFSLTIKGQDVIVKKDGTTILSKVLEVNQDIIKYKKNSNLDGPVYSVSVNDIISINYANGEVDKFTSQLSINDSAVQNHSENNRSFINDGLISAYNDRDVICNVSKSQKKAKWIYRLLRVHNGSVIGNEDVKMNAYIKQYKLYGDDESELYVTIENCSDRIIYLDLGSSSYRKSKSASTFFVNSSTTKSNGQDTGGSVNLGSIASVLGVGGAIGTIASGTTLGGQTKTGTSTTIYAERIITVAPHSVYTLPAKKFYSSSVEEPYKKGFKYGDRFKYKQPDKLKDSPWEIILSYAKEDDIENTRRLDMGIFISEEISVKSSWDDCIKNITEIAPIHYYYRVD